MSSVGIGAVEVKGGQGRRADDGGLQRSLFRSADDIYNEHKFLQKGLSIFEAPNSYSELLGVPRINTACL